MNFIHLFVQVKNVKVNGRVTSNLDPALTFVFSFFLKFTCFSLYNLYSTMLGFPKVLKLMSSSLLLYQLII